MTTTPGRLILPISEPIFTQTGLLDPGAQLEVFLSGTTTLAEIYTSSALTSTMTNPQTANAAGRFYAQSTEIWGDASQAYDVVVTLTDGEVLTFDGIDLVAQAATAGDYALLTGAAFTGLVTGITPSVSDDSNAFATTAFSQELVAPLATLASPTFTGTPEAPTAAAGTNSTQIATTAFVQSELEVDSLTSTTTFGATTVQWNPKTFRVVVKGVYSATITEEGPISIAMPGTMGNPVFASANTTNTTESDIGSAVAQIVSLTSTTLTVYVNDSQTGGQAHATGFWWTAEFYSATEPPGA